MSELQQEEQQHLFFQSLMESFYLTDKGNQNKAKAQAWDRFTTLGLPTRKTEVYKYVRLKNLFSQSFTLGETTTISLESQWILPECKSTCLVFVNGHFMAHLSTLTGLPKQVAAIPLSEASKTFSTFFNNQWNKSVKEESDPFTALNGALHRDGLFIYIPPKTKIEQPIQFLFLTDTQTKKAFILPRIQIFAGAQSEADFVATQQKVSGSQYCINLMVDFSIEEDSHVTYTQVALGAPDEAWHFDACRAHLKRHSSFKTFAVTDGAGTIRYDYRVALTGENCEAKLNGISTLENKREAHVHVCMEHQAPHCRSMQLFKNILSDFSRASFEGKILVRQAAQKTEAFQLNNNLLLSDRAQADSKPNLEIFADDVKASHGATVGQLDSEQLFYLKARGFSDALAKKMLVSSFCKEVIDQIKIASLKDSLYKI